MEDYINNAKKKKTLKWYKISHYEINNYLQQLFEILL